ncbi:glycosyltransferase family 4 protein [Microbacterium sp. Se5.02b]|uniref:glycosyltransferase family 4 protein n=1 Tax=Microbacterium sp. Se5.02b TaxID=2864103 RepID=UPI00215DBCCC|nr:glycosyltransferase [Microbacterium sp. Se5.02b]
MLNAWRRVAMRGIGDPVRGTDGWAFLRGLAAGASAVTAPSTHFAARLEQHDVFPRVDVIWNGIDDDLRDEILAAAPAERTPGRPRFVWLGRMSPEKRLLPFLEAFVASGVDADLEVIGGGAQRAAAEKIVAGHAGVHFAGRLTYPQTLARIAAADALVQTSIGFETQGMTPFEAATLGTPSVICDPDIAAELGGGSGRFRMPAPTRRAASSRVSGSLRSRRHCSAPHPTSPSRLRPLRLLRCRRRSDSRRAPPR